MATPYTPTALSSAESALAAALAAHKRLVDGLGDSLSDADKEELSESYDAVLAAQTDYASSAKVVGDQAAAVRAKMTEVMGAASAVHALLLGSLSDGDEAALLADLGTLLGEARAEFSGYRGAASDLADYAARLAHQDDDFNVFDPEGNDSGGRSAKSLRDEAQRLVNEIPVASEARRVIDGGSAATEFVPGVDTIIDGGGA